MKIGFIGLGKMGGGLARNLIRSGYDVVLYDISDRAINHTLEVGGKAANSPAELASQVDILFTSLPLPIHLLDLLINNEGILNTMKSGSILIDVSTIDPQTARQISDAAANKNIEFLACPLGKGPLEAEKGIEPIFVGGKREVYEGLKNLLNKMGDPVYYLGDVEQSTAFKIISNLVGMSNLLILCEGLHLGAKAGIDPQLLQDLLSDTGANSHQLKLRGKWILNDDYNSRFSVNLASKDVRLGVEMSNFLDQMAPFSTLALKYFEKANESGYNEEDCAAVYKIFNDLNNK
jgi:3-hydroxyisobutyrate dehydrogenase-like beta-hydroxyacid dehydrogenase